MRRYGRPPRAPSHLARATPSALAAPNKVWRRLSQGERAPREKGRSSPPQGSSASLHCGSRPGPPTPQAWSARARLDFVGGGWRVGRSLAGRAQTGTRVPIGAWGEWGGVARPCFPRCGRRGQGTAKAVASPLGSPTPATHPTLAQCGTKRCTPSAKFSCWRRRRVCSSHSL